MKSPITFVKVVATPTLTSWSHAYTAGNIAAVVSLALSPSVQKSETVSLPGLGKDILNTFESEYFTLEKKNLHSIKQAVQITCEKVPQEVSLSFISAVIIENILYLYLCGSGRILMKRDNKLGVLLEQEDGGQATEIAIASGFIQDKDIVILETGQFSQTVSDDILSPLLSEDKIATSQESIAPLIHEKHEGGATAVLFSYSEDASGSLVNKEIHLPTKIETEVTDKTQENALDKEKEEEKQEEDKQELEKESTNSEEDEKETQNIPFVTRKVTLPKKPFSLPSFSHTRKLFLTIAIIIVLVLGGSIFFAIKKQQDYQRQKTFNTLVVPAQKKIEEGENLVDLNTQLATDDFNSAKTMLENAKSHFPSKSSQIQQVDSLLTRVTNDLTKASNANSANLTPADASASPLLAALLENKNSLYGAEDSNNIYLADNTSVTQTNKSTQKQITIIKNSKAWKSIGGFETYLENFYILDKSAGILKYVGSGSNYSSSAYFTSSSPDLSKATDIAIDGSIWILGTDGSIGKYTRGQPVSFTIKGLAKSLVNPSRIITTVDMNNVYVLDNGNKRIVVFDKNGNYVAQYTSDNLGNATAMQIDETNKKAYVLASGKIWQLSLK